MDKESVVLISGCSSGIGLALAREFASRGCMVFATARRPEVIEQLKKEKMEIAALDVTDLKSIETCVHEVIGQTGRIDVLVNNAGYMQMGPVIDLSKDDLMRQFETNVIGLATLTRAVAPHMIKRRCGLIVNISSVSGVCATPFAGAYCATKAAVNLLSDSLRMELAPFGITVATVQPGAIKSHIGEAATKSIIQREDSVYWPLIGFIKARAVASQKSPTTAEDFSRVLVDKLFRTKIPKLIRIGKESIHLPLLKKLPVDLLDRLMSKNFGLDQLK
ncbi:MAG: SDR family NAD(P)-dependent oxidoreductase [Syntrophales bacterium]|nr:SDR family NAD(P)-dependent oxidoreductase [Syntrophales bacterium]